MVLTFCKSIYLMESMSHSNKKGLDGALCDCSLFLTPHYVGTLQIRKSGKLFPAFRLIVCFHNDISFVLEYQPLNGQISLSSSKGSGGTGSSSSSTASSEVKLEISFVSCPKCPTHLGLLVKAWRVWICAFEPLTDVRNCTGEGNFDKRSYIYVP